MITALYASLAALIIVSLSRNVIGLRGKLRVRLGDGGSPELQAAIRAQANATEYIPITLLLMLLLELAAAPWWLIHPAGIALITGRLLHASALQHNNIRRRILAMKISLYQIYALAFLNIAFLIASYF